MKSIKHLLILALLSFPALLGWNLHIKPLGSKTITLSFKQSNISLTHVKSRITEYFAQRGNTVAESSMTLLYKNKPLEATEIEQCVYEEATLMLLIHTKTAQAAPNTLNIKTHNDKSLIINYYNQITVAEIKEILAPQLSITPKDLIVLYNNTQLPDSHLINKNGSCLQAATHRERAFKCHLRYLRKNLSF